MYSQDSSHSKQVVLANKMKLLRCLITLLMLIMTDSHPVNMICMPQCNANITASEKFVNEWLNRTSDTGMHQLRNNMGTIISMLMENAPTHVS